MQDNRQIAMREKLRRQELERRKARVRFFAVSFVFIALLSGVITAIIELPGKLQTGSDSNAATQSNSMPAANGTVAGPAASDATPLPEATVATGEPGPQPQAQLSYNAPTPALLALPANGRVDMAYFTDALFIGDSLTQGFQVYSSGISNAHYAAYMGAGPKDLISGTVTNVNGEMVSAMDEILAAAPKKVYILLGTNALTAQTDEALVKYYEDFLNTLQPQLPADTVYYLQAIPPVTAAKAEASPDYAGARIQGLNEKIAAMAYARGWHYLDLYGALADESGALREDLVAGSDGIHLNRGGYETWKEFLVTHTAYNQNSPYIAGSPYMA